MHLRVGGDLLGDDARATAAEVTRVSSVASKPRDSVPVRSSALQLLSRCPALQSSPGGTPIATAKGKVTQGDGVCAWLWVANGRWTARLLTAGAPASPVVAGRAVTVMSARHTWPSSSRRWYTGPGTRPCSWSGRTAWVTAVCLVALINTSAATCPSFPAPREPPPAARGPAAVNGPSPPLDDALADLLAMTARPAGTAGRPASRGAGRAGEARRHRCRARHHGAGRGLRGHGLALVAFRPLGASGGPSGFR